MIRSIRRLKDFKNILIFFLLIVLLVYGQIWATEQEDTLRPASDLVSTLFSSYPTHTSDSLWMQADDPGGVSDGDTTYNLATQSGCIWVWNQAYWSTTNIIDSVALTFQARKTAAGALVVTLGRRMYDAETGWYWCIYNGSADTVSYATTTSYANYRISWLTDPCTTTPWDTGGVRGGGGTIYVQTIGINSIRDTWAFIVVYSHAEAVAEVHNLLLLGVGK